MSSAFVHSSHSSVSESISATCAIYNSLNGRLVQVSMCATIRRVVTNVENVKILSSCASSSAADADDAAYRGHSHFVIGRAR